MNRFLRMLKFALKCGVRCAPALPMLLAAAQEVSVTARQDWPWSSRVIVELNMPEGTNDADIVAHFDSDGSHHDLVLNCDNGLDKPVYSLSPGVNRFVWNPTVAGFSNGVSQLSITAEAVPFNDRAWLLLDLSNGTSKYVALGAAPTNALGYPWQELEYKTRYIVFRRIPKGTYSVGYTDEQVNYLNGLSTGTPSDYRYLSQRSVTMSSDYYIAIYQTTEGQDERIKDQSSTSGLTSVEGDAWRGYMWMQRGSNAVCGINWPITKYRVDDASRVGLIRARFGNRFKIDLPTSAQWQIAAHPDPQWIWYDTPEYGGGTVSDSETTQSNILAKICRAWVTKSPFYGPAAVGEYQPNRYGLYDLVASRSELILDAFSSVAEIQTETIDPVGAAINSTNAIYVTHNAYKSANKYASWGLATVNTRYGDSMKQNNGLSYRYVINLNPPSSFGGKWE